MAHIRPFAGIRFAQGQDVSRLIAPPYDVLHEHGKAALQSKSPYNVVNIDLPHLPAKTAGPDEVYVQANATLQGWLTTGVLKRDARRALYPYAQTYEHQGHTHHRRGFIALVRLSPFGEGHVVPHEKTYKGPIEDRLKLMRATGVQLSPIFGLFSDPRNEVTGLLYRNASRPELSGTLDGVKNDLWSVIDAEVENQVIDLMGHKPIYIADGHHRYTTALQFQKESEAMNGGAKLPPDHPANYCMFVLIGMQDPGLLILPTHRLIGGLSNFDLEAFGHAIAPYFSMEEMPLKPSEMDKAVHELAAGPANTFGLYDGAAKRLYRLRLISYDLLKKWEPTQSEAWRQLDVAILQRYLLDEVLQPRFAGGRELVKGYTAHPNEIVPQVDGNKYQLALLLRPTPLHALEELGKHGEVMPQKSTFFFPKLATGMVMYPLR
jgi:uncharacterized protein (DUF1015 family)